MKGSVDLQKYVGLLVTGPAKMKIIHGEGPINLVGSHTASSTSATGRTTMRKYLSTSWWFS